MCSICKKYRQDLYSGFIMTEGWKLSHEDIVHIVRDVVDYGEDGGYWYKPRVPVATLRGTSVGR